MKIYTLKIKTAKLIIQKWGRHLLLGTILFAIPMMALFLKGQQAVRGLTWEYKIKSQPTSTFTSSLEQGFYWGVYDPDNQFINSNTLAIDHYFISWLSDPQQLLEQIQSTLDRNRWPLVTLEPYPYPDQPKGEQTILIDIVNQKYDQSINKFCGLFSQINHPVFIRWGHEMENVTGRYPWASEDASAYIEAYKYFVNLCRQQFSQGYYIWSPVGHMELTNYWPGELYVDYIGLSLYVFTDWELDHFHRFRSFSEILNERYRLVQQYQKPVIIAEMGINGEPGFQTQWLTEAFAALTKEKYPLLRTLVYFNAMDSPDAWGTKYPVPDWRIEKELFEESAR